MTQRVFKTGNSLAVTIPARFINSVGARAGDEVKVHEAVGKGHITFKFSGTQQLALDEGFLRGKRKINK